MAILKETLEACFSPIGVMVILLVAGFLATRFRRQSRMGRRLVWGGVWLYIAFVVTPLAEVLVSNLERPFSPMLHPDASAGAQTIVILSGYGKDYPSLPVTSKISGETISRIVEGLRLYHELPGARLVVSGGVVHKGDRPVASLMADFIRAMGVPERDIVIEGHSLNTYENLVEVKKIIGTAPFILVTTACDLRRATAVARKLEMKPLAAPAAIWAAQRYPAGMSWLEWTWNLIEGVATPSTERLGYLQRANHEYLGFLWYRILGRI